MNRPPPSHLECHFRSNVLWPRYRKGEIVLLGKMWYEVHAECMVMASEAVLPMAITAIVATGGLHRSSHAK